MTPTRTAKATWELSERSSPMSNIKALKEALVGELKRAQEVARREAERFALEEESRKEWMAGFRPYWRGRTATGGALLRVSGGELQTSLGAAVPLSHAVRVFRFVAECRAKGTSWQANGHTLHVGHFTVDRVYPNGDFKAGCHLIEWAESARIAAQLGLDVPANPITSH